MGSRDDGAARLKLPEPPRNGVLIGGMDSGSRSLWSLSCSRL